MVKKINDGDGGCLLTVLLLQQPPNSVSGPVRGPNPWISWDIKDLDPPGSAKIKSHLLTTSGSSRPRNRPQGPMVEFGKSTHGEGLCKFLGPENW